MNSSKRISDDCLDLEDIVKKVKYKGGKPLFITSSRMSECQAVIWAGNNVDEFLELSRNYGDGELFLLEGVVGEDDEGMSGHVGETWLVEVAFIRNGIFHVFKKVAPWAEERLAVAQEKEERRKEGRRKKERARQVEGGTTSRAADSSGPIERDSANT